MTHDSRSKSTRCFHSPFRPPHQLNRMQHAAADQAHYDHCAFHIPLTDTADRCMYNDVAIICSSWRGFRVFSASCVLKSRKSQDRAENRRTSNTAVSLYWSWKATTQWSTCMLSLRFWFGIQGNVHRTSTATPNKTTKPQGKFLKW